MVGSLTIHRFKWQKESIHSFLFYISIVFCPGWSLSAVIKVWKLGLLLGGILDYETFLEWYSRKSVLKIHTIRGTIPAGWNDKEYPETDLQQFRLGITKETIQFIKIHNEYRIHTICTSTNLISFVILSGLFLLG